MNIKELKKLIKDLPDDMEIIMQSDPEGNGYSPLEDLDIVLVENLDDLENIYDLKWTADDADMDEDEWKEFKQTASKCVNLCPRY